MKGNRRSIPYLINSITTQESTTIAATAANISNLIGCLVPLVKRFITLISTVNMLLIN